MSSFSELADIAVTEKKKKKIVFIILIILIAIVIIKRDYIFEKADYARSRLAATWDDVRNSKGKKVQPVQNEAIEDDIDNTPSVFIVTENSVNIREGASVNYNVKATAQKDEEFRGTGKTDTASNGRIWYEIYLDEDGSETGWISSKVCQEKQ